MICSVCLICSGVCCDCQSQGLTWGVLGVYLFGWELFIYHYDISLFPFLFLSSVFMEWEWGVDDRPEPTMPARVFPPPQSKGISEKSISQIMNPKRNVRTKPKLKKEN